LRGGDEKGSAGIICLSCTTRSKWVASSDRCGEATRTALGGDARQFVRSISIATRRRSIPLVGAAWFSHRLVWARTVAQRVDGEIWVAAHCGVTTASARSAS